MENSDNGVRISGGEVFYVIVHETEAFWQCLFEQGQKDECDWVECAEEVYGVLVER